MTSDLVQCWRMSNEANLYLLANLSPTQLRAGYASRTRDVGAQLAHIHGTRLRWLKHAAPKLAEGIATIPKGEAVTKARLKKALVASAKAIERFLEECDQTGRVKSWTGPPATFLGYLVAHEAHHRGLALVAMRIAGCKVPQEVVYGLWQWGKKRSMR